MAENVEQVRVLKRGGGAAATFAFLAMVLSAVALVIALHAQTRANDAAAQVKTAEQKVQKLSSHLDNALGKQSTTGNAANTSNTTGGNNQVPTVNGQ